MYLFILSISTCCNDCIGEYSENSDCSATECGTEGEIIETWTVTQEAANGGIPCDHGTGYVEVVSNIWCNAMQSNAIKCNTIQSISSSSL